MKRIEFGELRIGPTARMHLEHVCDTNWASMGKKVAEFEKQWSELFDYTDSVAVSSGTDAVLNCCLSLYDHGAQRGDRIIVPALSFIATSNAVRAAGFLPYFVDVGDDLNLNIDRALEAANEIEDVWAIIAVNTMGQMCDMERLVFDVPDDILIFEDSAEAHAAKTCGLVTGKWAEGATFSYYTAHICCAGEGGAISTQHPHIADILRSTRSHGRKRGELYFDHVRTGLNSKMNDLEASLGLEGLSDFWKTFFIRSENIKSMLAALPDGSREIGNFIDDNYAITPEEYARFPEVNCPHGFSITAKKFASGLPGFDINLLKDQLDKANIHHKRNFGSIPTQHGAFKDMGFQLGDFPNSEWIGDHGIHLGCHQYLTDNDLDRICNVLSDFFTNELR